MTQMSAAAAAAAEGVDNSASDSTFDYWRYINI